MHKKNIQLLKEYINKIEERHEELEHMIDINSFQAQKSIILKTLVRVIKANKKYLKRNFSA